MSGGGQQLRSTCWVSESKWSLAFRLVGGSWCLERSPVTFLPSSRSANAV